jgi:hypothetical protein
LKTVIHPIKKYQSLDAWVQVGNSSIFFLNIHWFFKYIGGVYFFFNLKTDPQRMQAIDLI